MRRGNRSVCEESSSGERSGERGRWLVGIDRVTHKGEKHDKTLCVDQIGLAIERARASQLHIYWAGLSELGKMVAPAADDNVSWDGGADATAGRAPASEGCLLQLWA